MKKVGRLRLSELEGRMDTLTKAEQHEYLGGNNTWRIYGESKTVARGAAEYNSRTAEVRLCISEKVWSEFSDRSTCAG